MKVIPLCILLVCILVNSYSQSDTIPKMNYGYGFSLRSDGIGIAVNKKIKLLNIDNEYLSLGFGETYHHKEQLIQTIGDKDNKKYKLGKVNNLYSLDIRYNQMYSLARKYMLRPTNYFYCAWGIGVVVDLWKPYSLKIQNISFDSLGNTNQTIETIYYHDSTQSLFISPTRIRGRGDFWHELERSQIGVGIKGLFEIGYSMKLAKKMFFNVGFGLGLTYRFEQRRLIYNEYLKNNAINYFITFKLNYQ